MLVDGDCRRQYEERIEEAQARAKTLFEIRLLPGHGAMSQPSSMANGKAPAQSQLVSWGLPRAANAAEQAFPYLVPTEEQEVLLIYSNISGILNSQDHFQRQEVDAELAGWWPHLNKATSGEAS